VTVVVPVRDRPDQLARCLAAIGPCAEVIVVDDASEHPEATKAVAAAAGARVVCRAVNGGPVAARNTGLAQCRTPLVAFVDSDCRPVPGWLDHLLPHLTDPAVGIVAPRVVASAEVDGWLSAYERSRSALDLGPREAPVVPCSRVAYVPSAALWCNGPWSTAASGSLSSRERTST
jgi:glycosyltransferase involved in cell wall biosynthesis